MSDIPLSRPECYSLSRMVQPWAVPYGTGRTVWFILTPGCENGWKREDYSHPGMCKTPLKHSRDSQSSLSSGVYSRDRMHGYSHLRMLRGKREASTLRRVVNIVDRMSHRAAWTGITDIKPHRSAQKGHPDAQHSQQRSDSRKVGPLCAEVSNHRGFTEGYPVSIQSFLTLFPGRAGNSAQKGIPLITGKRKGRPLCASSPLLFPGWSPGPPRLPLYTPVCPRCRY